MDPNNPNPNPNPPGNPPGNFEIPKIPLITLAGITSLTNLLHELPLPGPHPNTFDYPLYATSPLPFSSVRKIANNTDPDAVAKVIDALSRTNADDIVLKDPSQDTDCLDGVNVPPLLQAILTKKPDIFYKKRPLMNEVGGDIKHSSPAQAITAQSPAISHTGLPVFQASPGEGTSQLQSSQSKSNPNKVTRNQVPPPIYGEQQNQPSTSKNEFTVESSSQPAQPQNPKICLKIRRKKKKGHDKGAASSSETSSSSQVSSAINQSEDPGVRYDIVAPSERLSEPSPGPLKLKLSRVKVENGTGVNNSPSFAISEIVKSPPPNVGKGHERLQEGNEGASQRFHPSSHKKLPNTNLSPSLNAQSHTPPRPTQPSSFVSPPPNMFQSSPHGVAYNNSLRSPHMFQPGPPLASPRQDPQHSPHPNFMSNLASPHARPPTFAKHNQMGSPHAMSHQRPPPPPYMLPTPPRPDQSDMHANLQQQPHIPQQQHYPVTPSPQRQKQVSKSAGGGHQSQRTPSSKPRKKNAKHIRVKFIADQEEADIYKLSDVMYPDDSEVSSFDELKSGMMVVAKWPQNGKLYEALVIDPLDNTGRKFRERKPPPKPFQADPGRREKRMSSDSVDSPRVMLDQLSSMGSKNNFDMNMKYMDGDFSAYHSMADRIKLKRQQRSQDFHGGKKRKRTDSADPTARSLITVDSDEDGDAGDDFSSPAHKRSYKDMKRKKERRRMAEMKVAHDGSGSGSLKRFTAVVEHIFEDMDRVDAASLQYGQDEVVPECLLIPPSRLHELDKESSKLKAMGIVNQVPKKTIARLMTILEPNIRAAVRLKPLAVKADASSHEQKWQQEMALERVYAAADSALTALNLMTSPGMPKAVFIEDVMERAIQLLRFQLENTIYPEYDSVYKVEGKKKGKADLHSASSKQKRAHYKGTKSRAVLHLYNKMISLMTLWVELLEIQPLTDTSVLQVSSVAISPFFVENVRELQLAAIRLTTAVFARYERHRKLILEDLFQSLARLPTSKRNLRNFRLNYVDDDYSDDEGTSSSRVMPYIQMVSALVLQMVQAIVLLPLSKTSSSDEKPVEEQVKVDELKVVSTYDSAMRTGQSFLAVFLKKCASKSEEIDYRPLFENFIHDLLATVNKPEWPASEMMLSILGRLLVHTFTNRQTEASLRSASIDYLGVIAAKLRRDAVSSQLDKSVIKQLIDDLDKAQKEELGEEVVKAEVEEEKPKEVDVRKDGEEPHTKESRKRKARKNGGRKKKDTKKRKGRKLTSVINIEPTENEMIEKRLHSILLSYVHSNAEADPALMFAHNFYVGQWLRDVTREAIELQNKAQKESKNDVDDDVETMETQSKLLQVCERRKLHILKLASEAALGETRLEDGAPVPHENGVAPATNSTPMKKKIDKISSQLTYDNATLMTRYLASTRPFSHSFDTYLTHILHIREETSVAVRTRAIKCLAEVVAVDPSILARKDIWQGVHASLVDASTSVREAAVDLVGKFILLKPELVPQYYKMLTARILDTGVSVRKRVIKILRDLCHEHPDLPQLTDACVKMIRRVNDEEGIKKLVHEVFMRMWFTPSKKTDAQSMRLKALSIADVVAANKDIGYEWIEQMMVNLIDTDPVNESVELACQQVVNCLVDHLIQIEQENPTKGNMEEQKKIFTQSTPCPPPPATTCNEADERNDSSDEKGGEDKEFNDLEMKGVPANGDEVKTKSGSKMTDAVANALQGRRPQEMIAATMRTLVLFAKIRPKLLVPHVMTLQPHLATKCESGDELHTLQSVCRVLELAVPLLEHPGEAFLASLEEDLMKLILREKFVVVQSAIACLGSVTKHITENYKLVWDCFQKLCSFLSNMRALHQNSGFNNAFNSRHSQLLRTLYITGHFMKTFDFDDELMKGKSQVCIKDKVYECIYYFTQLEGHQELRLYAIGCLGLLMIQDPNMMFRNETKECYRHLLDPGQKLDLLKNQVLMNLQTYLSEEDIRMQEAAKASSHKKKEDPMTMGLHARKVFEQQQHQQEESEDIKEICDVSSGMASSVMQVYLKQVLECFFHVHLYVRRAALNTVYLTLNQGLVHPLQCVPFVIAMSTDGDPLIFNKSEQLLTEIGKRYSGFIHAKALHGFKMAYRLQCVTCEKGQVTRGCRAVRGVEEHSSLNKACCSQLYTLIRSDRKHRRALMLGLLNLFDDTVKSDLGLLLFIADNLAYFPYVSQDEPLYVMSQIEVYVSVSGSNVLQTFKEGLKQKREKAKKMKKKKSPKQRTGDENLAGEESSSSSSSSSSSEDSDNDLSDAENERGILSRLPRSDIALTEFMESSMACLLLLCVKQHLKSVFGFTDNKVHRYSPNEPVKAYDKQVMKKRADLVFEPKRVTDYLTKKMNRDLPVHPSTDLEYKKLIVAHYMEFNELMNKLDPNDADSDSDKESPVKKTPKKIQTNEPKENGNNVEGVPAPETNSSQPESEEESDKDSDAEPPKKETALDIIRKSGMAKHKNKLLNSNKGLQDAGPQSPAVPKELRMRKKVQYIESSNSEDSDSEFMGF